MQIAIIGGGASGLMCGAVLNQNGFKATIFDGNEKVGKKIYITGKGRCNVTNACMPNEFIENVVRGNKFMLGAINKFNSFDMMNFLEDNGLKLKVERGERVFPESDKASDVTKTLLKLNNENTILLNQVVENVEKIIQDDKAFFRLTTNKSVYNFDVVVVATGGKTYSLTGSTGFGYKVAEKFGHKLIKQVPGLTAIELNDKFISDIQGLPLKNVAIKANYLTEEGKNKNLNFFGEMMFTNIGITGPIILTLSSYINRAKNVKLAIDFKPALNEEQLDSRLLRDFDNNKNKNISYIIHGLLPNNFVDVFLHRVGIAGEKKVNSITKEERVEIIKNLKTFELSFKKLYPIETGIITSGGVCLDEINPKSCESKLQKNLYFIGEVLDIDALTGGFNLQIAFSTAYICATDMVKKLKEE